MPTIYTPELGDRICEHLAQGMSLIGVSRIKGMPPEATCRGWANNPDHDFAAKYTRAREIGYSRMADELLEIADDGSNDWMSSNDPEDPGYRVNGEHIQRSRARLDTRKWLLSKMLPKVYGDKQTIDMNATVSVKDVPEDELDARISRHLAGATEAGVVGSAGGAGVPAPTKRLRS